MVAQVPDVESDAFWERMNRLVDLNAEIVKIERGPLPKPLQAIAKLPLTERMVANMAQIFFLQPRETGSVDLEPQVVTQY